MELSQALQEMSDAELAALLHARPDLATPPPRNIAELARRAVAWRSIDPCLAGLDRFCRQLLEALCLLDDGASVADVREILGPDPTAEDVEAGLGRLQALALLHRDGARLHLPGDLRARTPHPAGLGRPLAQLLALQPAAMAKLIAAGLGARETTKAAITAELVPTLGSPAAVRKLLASAPAPARKLMSVLAEAGPTCGVPWNYSDHLAPADTAAGWLQRRGLLVPTAWGMAEVPREVGLALRDGRAFSHVASRCPPVQTSPADATKLDDCAAHAGATVVEALATLLAEWGAAPATERKAGGLAVRELRRAAKLTDLSERDAARLIEIAYAAGLIGRDRHDPLVAPTPAFDHWLAEGPAGRWLQLVEAWRQAPGLCSLAGERDADDKLLPPLWGGADAQAAAQRAQVLEGLAGLGDDQAPEVDSLADHVTWVAPARWHGYEVPPATLVQWVLEEAELLGVTAMGSLRGPARLLLAGKAAAASDSASRLLPTPGAELILQADLTAVASGPLVPDVAARLSEVADVESKGAGTVYRLSEASIRRALDQGRSGSEIRAFLDEHATRGIPQPLAYLIDDVARRHGVVRVGPATSYVVSTEPALLAEVARARRTANLGLRPLAPSVLVSQVGPADLVAGLRAAGFLPAAEGADGAVVVSRPEPRRAPAPARSARAHLGSPAAPKPKAVATLVKALRDAPATATPERAAKPKARRAAQGSALFVDPDDPGVAYDPAMVRELIDMAADLGCPVEIGYTNSNGSFTTRVIEPLEVGYDTVTAFCDLRHDERTFLLSGIDWATAAMEE